MDTKITIKFNDGTPDIVFTNYYDMGHSPSIYWVTLKEKIDGMNRTTCRNFPLCRINEIIEEFDWDGII